MSEEEVEMNANDKKKRFSCSVCDYSANLKQQIQIHERTHTGEKPYKCDICDKSFTQKSSWNAHQRIHTKQKPYLCCVCFKAFSYRSSLKSHERVHTGEKRFSCKHCSQRFVNKIYCLKHEKKCKEKEERYKFVDCGESVKQEIKEEIEERDDPLSSDNNEFSCDVCQEVFSKKIVLFMHKDLNHW